MIDDRKPVAAGMKFSLQIIAAYVAMIYGVRIYGLSFSQVDGLAHFSLWIVQIVTILWLVGLSNAVNLVDAHVDCDQDAVLLDVRLGQTLREIEADVVREISADRLLRQ